jgi:hypothetical protein
VPALRQKFFAAVPIGSSWQGLGLGGLPKPEPMGWVMGLSPDLPIGRTRQALREIGVLSATGQGVVCGEETICSRRYSQA